MRAQNNFATNSSANCSTNTVPANGNTGAGAGQPSAEAVATTNLEFKVATQLRIDAALEANRLARAAPDPAQLQAARTQIEQIWAGLPPNRATDTNRLEILKVSQYRWREDLTAEADDPAAN